MRESRRKFFVSAALLSGALAAPNAISFAQFPPTPPPPPKPAQTPNPAEIHSDPAAAAAAKRARLVQNEKEFREGVERLYQLTSDLREELQKTMTSDVLSVRMIKKTEEIEKLAKLLKNKAKGA
jgi:succinate dehydrogenase/fumarate reductase flavoprotein subunit